MANRASELGQRAVDSGIGAGHAGNADANRLDPSHIMPGIVEVEERFRQVDQTLSSLFQRHQTDRIDRLERNVLGDFVLAFVLVEVGDVHPFEIVSSRSPLNNPFFRLSQYPNWIKVESCSPSS